MKKVIGLAIIAVSTLGGCTYEAPSPYAYFPVPCTPASGTITPNQLPAVSAPVETASGSGQCVAVVPTYTYPTYYPYSGYYYPGYYGPPVSGSMFIGGHFH